MKKRRKSGQAGLNILRLRKANKDLDAVKRDLRNKFAALKVSLAKQDVANVE